MGKKLELAGRRFGKWIVLEEVERNRHGQVMWRCRCECGREGVIVGGRLVHGYSQQCRRCSGRKDDLEVVLWQSYMVYQKNARLAGRPWRLSKKLFVALVTKPCNYCGALPVPRRIKGSLRGALHGLDRVDNTRGYYAQNVTSACFRCNRLKSTLLLSDFLAHIDKIHAHQHPPTPLVRVTHYPACGEKSALVR